MDNDQVKTSPGTGDLPIWARVHLGHAVVQWVAAEASVRVLHLKGPAALPHLRAPGKTSTDVDVLVHPDDRDRFETALGAHGWERRTTAAKGSVFGHAANWWHDSYGFLDVHHLWPGPKADPVTVFERFARGDHLRQIAHVACPVPGEAEQLLIVILHAARSVNKADVKFGWGQADDVLRQEVRALARELGAEVPFAIGIGESADTSAPDYALWDYYSRGGTDRFEEWRARLKATPGVIAKARLVGAGLGVNREHLRLRLGHEPSSAEVWREQARRIGLIAQRLRGRS